MPHAERYAELLAMLPGEVRMKEVRMKKPEQSHEKPSSPTQKVNEEVQEEAPYCVETRTAQPTDHRGAIHVCHERREVGISKLNLST